MIQIEHINQSKVWNASWFEGLYILGLGQIFHWGFEQTLTRFSSLVVLEHPCMHWIKASIYIYIFIHLSNLWKKENKNTSLTQTLSLSAPAKVWSFLVLTWWYWSWQWVKTNFIRSLSRTKCLLRLLAMCNGPLNWTLHFWICTVASL